MSSANTDAEARRAVELAEPFLDKASDYRLSKAINMVARNGEYRGPTYWQLTFKRRDLVPADASSELGAGGEIFVDVDTATGVAKITGRGE